MANERFGGETRLVLNNGRRITLRGDFTLMPGNAEAEAITNQDGSLSQSVTLTAPSFEVSFEDSGGVDWDDLIRQTGINATVTEDYPGVIHTFTNGFFTGRAEVDRKTGEVTGLVFNAQVYRKSRR